MLRYWRSNMSIKKILQRLDERNLDAYIITHNNCFLGQDISDKENKIRKLCGFSGSSGMLVVSKKGCFLFVDGRYELQAKKEVNLSQITIVHQMPNLNNVCALLVENGLMRIGFDGWCFSIAEMQSIKLCYGNISFSDVGNWADGNTPDMLQIKERETQYSGEDSKQKCQRVFKKLKDLGVDYCLLTAADSVSWLLNIYVRDLPYTPIVRGYALWNLHTKKITLFADNLQSDILSVKPMYKLAEFLHECNKRIVCDFGTTPLRLLNPCLQHVKDVCQELKAQKNEKEIWGMNMCHIRDGVAVVRLLMWLEKNWQGKTELDVVQKLHELRSEQELFFSESFATIAAVGANGAVVHYQPNEATNKKLEQGKLLLIDSGGQYMDGTTDVTRTIALGVPADTEIDYFTQVLKAHIAVADAQFPFATTGQRLDALARAPMWKKGFDYKHGTGHGVACFGNVHEGPIGISEKNNYGFNEGMVTSIEPGIYMENQFGIRIENLYFTQQQENGFLKFVPLTRVPIDKKLININLLNADERNWLNSYHEAVYYWLHKRLSAEEKKWLHEACAPI